MMQKKQSLAQNENPYAYTVVQNLKDAGCTDKMVEKFMALQDSEGEEQQLRLLSGHRKHLLEKLHRDERRIDCLDYLIYQMEKKKMKMNVNVNGQDFTATLENNSAVAALVQMMENGSVTLQLDDYAGFEKVGPLGQSLPASDSQTTTQAGDIVLYQGNQIVMFYGSNSWSYTKLGRIDDLTGWEEALGSGDVTATLSMKE